MLECELRYAVRHEWARTLGDLRRRTRYSIGPCEGTRCFMMGAQILAEELGLSPEETFAQLGRFMEKSWKGRAPVLDGTGLQQEELCSSVYFNVACMDRR